MAVRTEPWQSAPSHGDRSSRVSRLPGAVLLGVAPQAVNAREETRLACRTRYGDARAVRPKSAVGVPQSVPYRHAARDQPLVGPRARPGALAETTRQSAAGWRLGGGPRVCASSCSTAPTACTKAAHGLSPVAPASPRRPRGRPRCVKPGRRPASELSRSSRSASTSAAVVAGATQPSWPAHWRRYGCAATSRATGTDGCTSMGWTRSRCTRRSSLVTVATGSRCAVPPSCRTWLEGSQRTSISSTMTAITSAAMARVRVFMWSTSRLRPRMGNTTRESVPWSLCDTLVPRI